MNTVKIEGKVPIAADAAELVLSYLEELNIKLVQANINNSYLIVADVESMIIEALKRFGKTTKLGNEEVLKIINDDFDDPDEFIKNYLADLNPNIQGDKVNRFMRDPNQRRLIRRPERAQKVVVKTNKKNPRLSQGFRYLISLLPHLFIVLAIIFNLFSNYGNSYYHIGTSSIFILLGVVVFSIYEFITGIDGELIVNIKQSIDLRYSFRGLFIANYLLTCLQYLNLYNYILDGQFFSSSDYVSDFDAFEAIIIFYTILFAFYEILILLRDHLPKFFPLEPEFRPFIRLITPPYLLAGSGIVIILITVSYWDYSIWGGVLVLFGILWAKFKNYKVSTRYYIVTISFIFFNTIFEGAYLFYTILYGFSIYLLFLIVKYGIPKIRSLPGRGLIRKIKTKYTKYYDD